MEDAIQLARHALANAEEGRANYSAALGYFLLSAGYIREAETLLVSALAMYPDYAPLHWYLGLLCARERRLKEASQSLLTAVTLDPKLDEAAASLAWVLGDARQFDQAAHYARQSLAIKAQPDRWAQLGWFLSSQNLWDEAVLAFAEALIMEPGRVETRTQLSTALQHLDRSDEALLVLTEGLLHAPNAPALLQPLIRLLLDLSRTEEAHRACHRLLQQHAPGGIGWYLLSLVLVQRKRFGVATRALVRARRLDPALPEIWLQTGWLALQTGNLRSARMAVTRLLELAPEETAGDILAAAVLQSSGDFQAASEHAQKAVTRAPQSAAAWRALAQVRMHQDRLDEAQGALNTALVLDPKDASPTLQAVMQWRQGVLQYKQGNPGQAISHLELALSIDSSLDEAAATLAWILHDKSRLVDAIKWARHAMARRVTPERLAQLGWYLLQQGLATQAIPLFEESLRTAAHVESTHLHLARALSEEGKIAQARQILQSALARFPRSQALLLAIGWLHRNANEFLMVQNIAEQVIALQPDCATAWLLLGLAEQSLDHGDVAAAHFRQALELDTSFVDASIHLAIYLRNQYRLKDAVAVIADALRHNGEHPELREWEVQLFLDMGEFALARRSVHQLLTKDRRNGRVWYLMAQTLHKLRRIKLATVAVNRAHRHGPHNAEAWILAAWLGIEGGHIDQARLALKQLVQRCPDLPDLDIQIAFILAACGDLRDAAMHAQAALARKPTSAQALHALGHVRLRQGYLLEAERLTRSALANDPKPSSTLLRQLGWILRTRGRPHEAVEAFRQASAFDDADPMCIWEYAETQALCGDLKSALVSLQRAREIKLNEPNVYLLHAQLLAKSGPVNWNDAVNICTDLMRRRRCIPDAHMVLLTLAAKGDAKARQALRLRPRSERLTLFQSSLDATQSRGSHSEFIALNSLVQRDFPDEAWVRTAALYTSGITGKAPEPERSRQARVWSRRLAMEAGTSPYTARQSTTSGARLRIAYVAAHFHRSLLMRVLAAHNFDVVDIFLYSDISAVSLGELANRICLEALQGQDLDASMHANQIDVAIDTVGVGPFLGQEAVLLQFARRVAPVQCAWLGSWASGGGVYDYLLSDEHAVPEASGGLYEEGIARLPGGQWCWEPPASSPDLSAPPQLSGGGVTLGCAVRAVRISQCTIQVWARLLTNLPNARLILMGEHGQNVQFRAELFAALSAAGVDLGRISFQAQCAHHDYLASYSGIDIALDSFPANGGLCLLDALWMGVPVVTLAGSTLGERQGLSILAAIGHMEWAASDEEGYISAVCALASDPEALARVRMNLRSEMAESPLIDGRRVAHAIETLCQQWRLEAQAIAQAPFPKERLRAVAQRQLKTWLEKDCRLDLSPSPMVRPSPIDISVVVVLFNQAGLSRQALSALADQTGVCFETILVDNASGAQIGRLLGRVDGARIVRNTENVGFLQAANQGAALANGRHILFLNSDAILHTNALRKAVDRLDSDQQVGAVGGRIVLADGKLQEAGCIAYAGGSTAGYGRGQAPDLPQFNFVRDVDFCSGAFLMVRHNLWRKLGGFDSAFAPAYYEDSDFCLRVQDAGFRVVYEPSVWVSHFEWGSAASNQEAIAMMDRNGQRFNTRHQARLALRPDPMHASPHLDRWRALRKTRILILDNGVPHMAAGGGLPRARLIVQALSDNDVTLFPMWDIDEDWRDVYASVPETVEVMLGIGSAGLETFLEQRTGIYDFVMVSRPPNMAVVDVLRGKRPELFDGMRVVYDAEALFALREIGKATLQGSAMPAEQAQKLLQEELELAQRADTVISVSECEAQIIRAAGINHIHLLSHAMDTRGDTPDWSQRENLLFVGAIHPNTPNEDSLLWFCREVMPLLRDRPGLGNICIDIVGDCTSGSVSALANEHVRLLSRVQDLTPCYDQHRVFIAPTRFGAGVPAKVIEAACNGIPMVVTPLLVGQLGWQAGHDILSADDPQAFANAIAALYSDPAQWRQLRTAMQDRTRSQYAPAQFQKTLHDIFTR